jgi:hypothetical protein
MKEVIKNKEGKLKSPLKETIKAKAKDGVKIVAGLAFLGAGVSADLGCVNIGTKNVINGETTPGITSTNPDYDRLGIKRLDIAPQAPCSPCAKSETTIYTPSSTETKDGQAIYFNAGEIKNVPAGTIISGDVEVNGQVLYDNNENTALVVKLLNGGSVRAPWGASGLENIPGNVLDQKAEEIAQQIRNTRPNTTVQIVGYDGQIVNPGYRSNYPRTHETPVYPSNTVENGQAVSLSSGETKNVPAGTIISGDVEVNGQVLYDNNENTALVVKLLNGGSVRAPWGASGLENIPGNVLDQKAEEIAQQIRNTRPGVDVQVRTFDGQYVNPNYQPWTHERPIYNQNYSAIEVRAGETYYLKNDRISLIVGDTRIINRGGTILINKNDGNSGTGQIVASDGEGIRVESNYGYSVIELPREYYMTDATVIEIVNSERNKIAYTGKIVKIYATDGENVMIDGFINGKPVGDYPIKDSKSHQYYWWQFWKNWHNWNRR